MFGFLASLASRFIPAITGLASKIVPAIGRAFAVGKTVAPKIIGAVGKAANAVNTGIAVGKAVKGAVDKVAPEVGKKVEEVYNKKIGGKVSIGDVVERGEKGLAKAVKVADEAKSVFANIPVLENKPNFF